MTSGATIHTRSGLLCDVKLRDMRTVNEKDKMDWANLRATKSCDEKYWLPESKTTGARCPVPH
jgi:hypothetical protein